MKCPVCTVGEMGVRDSRPTLDDASVRRRRVCEHCGHRATTVEMIVDETRGGAPVVGHGAGRTTAMIAKFAALSSVDATLVLGLLERLNGDLRPETKVFERRLVRAAADPHREESLRESWRDRKKRLAAQGRGRAA